MISRRNFLAGTAAGTASLAACSACSKIDVPPQRVAVMTDVDAKAAGLFGGLELVAISAYQTVLAAGGPKLPAAAASFANIVLSHHQRALDQWNSALALSQAAAVSQPHPLLKDTVDQGLTKVVDAKSFARLALVVEQTISDSYMAGLARLQAKSALTLAGAFQVVDEEHVAVLRFFLGEYPAPDDFQKADHAVG